MLRYFNKLDIKLPVGNFFKEGNMQIFGNEYMQKFGNLRSEQGTAESY